MGDMSTPTFFLFQPYDLMATLPVEFTKANSSNLCPVGSLWAGQRCCCGLSQE